MKDMKEYLDDINKGLPGWKTDDKHGNEPRLSVRKLVVANAMVKAAEGEKQAAIRDEKWKIQKGEMEQDDASPEAQMWAIMNAQWEQCLKTLADNVEYWFDSGGLPVRLTENNDRLRAKLTELTHLFHIAKYFKLCANEKCDNYVDIKLPPYRHHKCECKACNYRRANQEMMRQNGRSIMETLDAPKYKFCSSKCASAQRSREYRRRLKDKDTITI